MARDSSSTIQFSTVFDKRRGSTLALAPLSSSQPAPIYRVTHQVVANLPLTSKQQCHFGLAWPRQNGTFVMLSMGGSPQPDVSPCTALPTDDRVDRANFSSTLSSVRRIGHGRRGRKLMTVAAWSVSVSPLPSFLAFASLSLFRWLQVAEEERAERALP